MGKLNALNRAATVARAPGVTVQIDAQNRAQLLALIERLPRQRIVMFGDLVADEFIYGEIARVSREAPVLILKQREREIVPGGGGNAANNLNDLGVQTVVVGLVGEDEPGDALLRYFRQKGMSTSRVLRLPGYRTPTKSRILGGLAHWQRQQIVRLDHEPAALPPPAVRRRLARLAAEAASSATGALISDYGYGTASPAAAARLRRSARRQARPVTVDSRFDLGAYRELTGATPNEPEIEAMAHRSVDNDLQCLELLGRRILRRQRFEALLVTRGRDGMMLLEPRRAARLLPIFGSDQAVDVTGAGDTVIAAFTAALAAGADFLRAAMLANCAAGLVVMKRGTATVTAEELKEAVKNA